MPPCPQRLESANRCSDGGLLARGRRSPKRTRRGRAETRAASRPRMTRWSGRASRAVLRRAIRSWSAPTRALSAFWPHAARDAPRAARATRSGATARATKTGATARANDARRAARRGGRGETASGARRASFPSRNARAPTPSRDANASTRCPLPAPLAARPRGRRRGAQSASNALRRVAPRVKRATAARRPPLRRPNHRRARAHKGASRRRPGRAAARGCFGAAPTRGRAAPCRRPSCTNRRASLVAKKQVRHGSGASAPWHAKKQSSRRARRRPSPGRLGLPLPWPRALQKRTTTPRAPSILHNVLKPRSTPCRRKRPRAPPRGPRKRAPPGGGRRLVCPTISPRRARRGSPASRAPERLAIRTGMSP
mmetsp:Transcript_3444/g.12524  ORF Transcript_3444/g.12524 Transcript_3444/m.12524 type:complete len:369 (-) Transcript_3444:39-1145(-)